MPPKRVEPRGVKRQRVPELRDPRDDDDDGDEEEPEGEDLYGENYVKDYVEPDEELEEDVSEDDADFIDDASCQSEISDHGRAAVDRLIDRRNELDSAIREAQEKHAVGVFSDVDSEEVVSESERSDAHPYDEKRSAIDTGIHAEDAIYDGEDPDNVAFDWMKPQCELSEWLAQEIPRRLIKRNFFRFLAGFKRGSTLVYEEKINAMIRDNGQSFEVSYQDLSEVFRSVLAIWLADLPDMMLEIMDTVANYYVFRRLFPHYVNVHAKVFVRISDMPLCDPIRDFRQIHMNVLVRVEGVVIRRSPVYPQMQAVKYDCARCSFIIGPIIQRGDKEQRVSLCPSCHSKGPFRVNVALTEYRNHQTILLQEPPGKVPPGRLPRSLEVVLTNDLIDRARPGEDVDITGVYKNIFDPLLNSKQGFPVFTTILVANNVMRRSSEIEHLRLPEEERRKILQLASHPFVKRKLIDSMASSIHGRDDIKLGLLLSMFGGVPKDVGGDQSHRIRGDINVLLVGDPGCAKSQFLKFVEKTSDRAVFTTGRGSTAVGLTASVHKDSVTGEFVLEGGALVIADRGVCLIDEFDKMSDQDRTSIHEAMEQQTISVAKGGIVTTLSARCSVIAAANPIGGRYDASLSFDSNVNLTTPILSRFDLLFVVRDEVNPEEDERLARFIGESHKKKPPPFTGGDAGARAELP